MIELHIWGPVSGLPSFDAECLAAILYLQKALPQETWRLVPSNNPRLNPFRRLPALRNDQVWVAGFEPIRQHLTQLSDNRWNLDSGHNELDQADCEAYASFLYSKGLPLLDLSLFVSSTNYTTFTRRALGDLLQWPDSWIVPHQLREKAKGCTEHLGLSALDVDTTQDDEKDEAGLTAKIPQSLRRPKQTVSGLLGRSTQKTRFRLDAVTEDFLEPLQSRLSGRDWLVGGQISSVDCLAIAIISLMQLRDLPQSWLRDALTGKYAQLGDWARTHLLAAFGDTADTTTIDRGNTVDAKLPWMNFAPPSLAEAGANAIEALISVVPVLRSGYGRDEVMTQGRQQAERGEEKQTIYAAMRKEQRLYSQLMATCVGSTSILAWLLHAGVLKMPHFRAQPSRRNFGEAGALLGL